MSFELSNNNNEFTEADFTKFANMDINDPELLKLMAERNISFDSGDIDVVIEGKVEKMVTSKNDFGTISTSKGDLPPPPPEGLNPVL